ncbi:GntR family transcriptional regulator [Sinorhizobium meliloti]|uniref:GntR family transcriptional regulator n=1 Tax=Rhizobium meliloti TaxID=382 RepID=UPI003BFA2843
MTKADFHRSSRQGARRSAAPLSCDHRLSPIPDNPWASAFLSGRFAPDERVNERRLAEQLGVKEALRQLETEGLAETLPRRGVLIRFNASWAEEMILARAALESMIARLAAKRIEKDEIQKVNEIVTRMANATEHGIADDLISQTVADGGR